MKLAHYLIRLYPHHWRSRYEEEFLFLLEERPLSLVDDLDLLRGALDAHLHPHLGTAALPWLERMKYMLSILRRSVLMMFCAYCIFILAGISFQKLTEDQSFAAAAQSHAVVGLMFNLVVIGSVVALLALVVGGLPIVVSMLRDAFTRRRYGILLLLVTPILALAIFIGIIKILMFVGLAALPISLSRGIFIGVYFGAAAVSIVAPYFAVARSDIPVRLLRFTILPSLLLTLAMSMMLLATLTWGLSLRNTVPLLFNGNAGMFGTSTARAWIGIVIVMSVATILALIALVHSISARSILPTEMQIEIQE
ncbi:hypothetical protein [Dictyobacter arantiisoli]|uniref:Uncharacterized protein n=1 Tax=Dictyobacter arantiisoli TaxID=2014874 RepID=A0A5A5TK75_9CHLR|nr:hypothetical protein [Dictyobacter arantiisoli]GCF11655.1 hypothetical protein KDI_52190 [Dictyobacter arantiisoli]